MGVLPLDTLRRYSASVFIETGTCGGDGIATALKAGFREVHSVELDAGRYLLNMDRFRHDPRVNLYKGESDAVLPVMLDNMEADGPMVFWLDAHPGGELTLLNCPVSAELRAIENRPAGMRVRAVMIDDMRLFSEEDRKWLESKLKQMFPTATIGRDIGIQDDDIMVALL